MKGSNKCIVGKERRENGSLDYWGISRFIIYWKPSKSSFILVIFNWMLKVEAGNIWIGYQVSWSTVWRSHWNRRSYNIIKIYKRKVKNINTRKLDEIKNSSEISKLEKINGITEEIGYVRKKLNIEKIKNQLMVISHYVT